MFLHRVKFLLCSFWLSLNNSVCMYYVLFVYAISFGQFFFLEFITVLPGSSFLVAHTSDPVFAHVWR